MSYEAVGKLIDRWMNEPTFREALRADAEGAVRATGMELEQDEWAALRAIDWRLSDQELEARVNKAYV